jgi:RNA polymerase sigma-70 factor, ECF subfamily
MDLTDEQIVVKVRKHDKELYREIVVRYEDKLLRYIKYLTQDEAVSLDILQDTFIKAYQNLNSFDINKKFSSWIYRIAHNEAVNKMKKRSHEIFNVDFEILGDIIPQTTSPDRDYEKEELVNNVRDCLQALPLKYREILTLFYLEDRSYEEISDILRISMGTVATRINRGKIRLKKLCGDLKKTGI